MILEEIPGYRFGRGRSSVNVSTRVVRIAAEVTGRERRYLLFHERIHLRIHDRFGRGRLGRFVQVAFDWISSAAFPAVYLWGSR